jgi:predicted membrane GTPase involved in stress response
MDSKFMICTDGNVQTMRPEGKPYVPLHYRSPTRMLVGWLVIVTLSAAFVYCVAMAAVTFN